MSRCVLAAVAVALLVAGASPAALADGGDDVHWKREWPRMRVIELVGTGVLVAATIVVRFAPAAPPDNWHGGVLFDDAVRDGLRGSSAHGRRTAGTLSDILWWSSMGWPLVVDPLVFALAVHGDGDTAAQLGGIALEGLTLAAFVAIASEHVGRQRPRAQDCEDAAEPDAYCTGGEANRSFLSGHALAAFAGAGMTCAAHGNVPLYGGGAPEVAACVAALGIATATGALRIVSDNHWMTDIFISSGVGLAIGALLPRALHFGFGGRRGAPTTARLVPLFGDGVGGLALAFE